MEYKAKKSLGQNFLKSEKAIKQIVEAGELKKTDTVLEIGPGTGILTEALLKTGAKVVAIEKDRELIPLLREKFKKELKNKQIQLIEGDILEINIKKIFSNFQTKGRKLTKIDVVQGGMSKMREGVQLYNDEHFGHSNAEIRDFRQFSYKLIANIPYYITGAIVRKFLEEAIQPTKIVVLVQKEVAERACVNTKSQNGKESLLSISIKAFGEPSLVAVVKAGSFVPAPKVDSAILSISNISRKNFIHNPGAQLLGRRIAGSKVLRQTNQSMEKKFFELIHIGFGHKRKTLMHNLKEVGIKSDVIARIFSEMEISEKIRAEDLHTKQWLALARSSILKK